MIIALLNQIINNVQTDPILAMAYAAIAVVFIGLAWCGLRGQR